MKKVKILLMICVVVLAAPLAESAQKELTMSLGEPEELFKQANRFYLDGQYEKAVKEYEKILQMGKQSGAIYYNLANSYFKTGQFGRAILNYERAERLLPRDADVKANYTFAISMVKDKLISKKRIWGGQLFMRYYNSFTTNELIWVSSLLFILFLMVIFLMLTRTFKLRVKIILPGIILFLLLFNTATVYYKVYSLGKDAVVVVPRADVLYGPFKSATKFFTLHEGSSVTIIESKGEWDKVRRSDNKTGWIPKKSVEAI
jgi:tetratricopeptide (TPR) repeat protein